MPGPGEAALSWKGESLGEGRWHPGQAPPLLPLQTSRSDALSSLGSPFQPKLEEIPIWQEYALGADL